MDVRWTTFVLTGPYLLSFHANERRGRQTLLFRASMFTIGLATSLSVLGLSATLAGKLFGSVSQKDEDHSISLSPILCPSLQPVDPHVVLNLSPPTTRHPPTPHNT